MRVTSFTPGSANTPLAEPTHSTGPSDRLGDGLVEGLDEGDEPSVGVPLSVGLADGEEDALTDGDGLVEGLAASATDGLAVTGSVVDGLLDGTASAAVPSDPVRVSSVTSMVEEGDGSGVDELVVEGDGDDDAAGVIVGDVDGLIDGLGETSTLDGTHNAGISAGICHALSSSGCEVASSLASWDASEETTCGDSAAQAAGAPAITTTIETNADRPARTRARVDRSLMFMGGNFVGFQQGSGMINRRSIQGKARTCLSRAEVHNEPSSGGVTNPRVVVESPEFREGNALLRGVRNR